MVVGSVYQHLRELEQVVKVPLIRPELEIILILYFKGPLPAGELENIVRCSAAGFGNIKRRLIESGVLNSERSNFDRRSNIIDISNDVRSALENMFGAPAVSGPHYDSSRTIFSRFDTEPGLNEPTFPIGGGIKARA